MTEKNKKKNKKR